MKCKIKPSQSRCMACLEQQQLFGVVQCCKECEEKSPIYNILTIGNGIFNSYAYVVMAGGKVEKFPLNRIIIIEEGKDDQNTSS